MVCSCDEEFFFDIFDLVVVVSVVLGVDCDGWLVWWDVVIVGFGECGMDMFYDILYVCICVVGIGFYGGSDVVVLK